jgi:formimidoylglutamate deiminase
MYRAANALSPDDIYDVARMAFLEMAASGITAVGEFHYLHRDPKGAAYEDRNLLARRVIDAARDVGIRIQLQRTAYVRADWGKEASPGQIRFLTPRVEDFVRDTERLAAEFCGDAVWVGVAPHSLRAVPLEYLREVTEFARGRRFKVHMHVSEQPLDVVTCLVEHQAPQMALLRREKVLDKNFTAVHAIHINDKELANLGASGAMVCACPGTERNLGDGVGPAPHWFARKTGVCLGTDSNAQIDLLEDARQLEYHLRLQMKERAVLAADGSSEGLARRLFTSATEMGAASIGAAGGSLKVGKAADFFTVDLDDLSIAGAGLESLLSNIVFAAGRSAIRDVYVGGRPVMQDGEHRLKEETVQRFAAVQRKLWGTAR